MSTGWLKFSKFALVTIVAIFAVLVTAEATARCVAPVAFQGKVFEGRVDTNNGRSAKGRIVIRTKPGVSPGTFLVDKIIRTSPI